MRTTTSRLPRSAGPMLVAATTLLLSVVPQLAFPQPALAVGTAQPAVPWSGRSSPTAGFGWPLGPPHPVLRRFDPPATRYGRGHRGVDLGGLAGQPVLAAGDGVVVYAAMLVDRPVISIEHEGGLRTTYEPVTPAVAAGQRVHRGEVIGYLLPGHPGCGAGTDPPEGPDHAMPSADVPSPEVPSPGLTSSGMACLHWGVRRGEEYLDPLRLVLALHVRLLRWRDGSG